MGGYHEGARVAAPACHGRHHARRMQSWGRIQCAVGRTSPGGAARGGVRAGRGAVQRREDGSNRGPACGSLEAPGVGVHLLHRPGGAVSGTPRKTIEIETVGVGAGGYQRAPNLRGQWGAWSTRFPPQRGGNEGRFLTVFGWEERDRPKAALHLGGFPST